MISLAPRTKFGFFNNFTIGKLLSHTNVHMTARYAHLAKDPLKSATNRIANRTADVAG